MSKADVAKKAATLEPKLKGKMFLGGNTPSAEDVKTFNDLLGDKNSNLYRWVKHMASFTEAERSSWGAPGKKLTEASSVAAAPAAKKEEKPAAAKKEEKAAPAPAPAAKPAATADDDDLDLFGDETEEEKAAAEAMRKKGEEARAKKKDKPAVIAKSSILLDVKPWDDTIDLEALAKKLKAVERDGLIWGAHKLVPIAFGVKKLQILLVIEDDKVTSDDIEEIVTGYEEEVQSMDIAAWNKI